MKSRITYQPGTSFLHHLHPLVKASWLLTGTVFVFVVNSSWAAITMLGLIVTAFIVAELPLGSIRGVRLFVMTALLLGLLQVFFVRSGEVLFSAGTICMTVDGIENGLYIAGRFLVVIFLSYLFVLSTDPNDLAYALMQIGLPYRYGFALITALRLVPVFEQEGEIVYQAQLARGVRYDTRSLTRLLDLAEQFFVPLLVSALGKVDALAVSMEGRCFGKYPDRTFLREVHFSRGDAIAVVLLMGWIASWLIISLI